MAKETKEQSDSESLVRESTKTVLKDGAANYDSRLPEDTTLSRSNQAANPDEQEAPTEPQSRAIMSQPMTASTSSSSNPSSRDIGAGASAPYGTRSRNRAGGSRPNYAEDRELEMDFDVQTGLKEDDPRRAVRAPERPQNMQDASIVGTANRRANGMHLEPSALPLSKDHIPGTLTFSANLTPTNVTQPSKKRKAMAQSSHSNQSVSLSANPGISNSFKPSATAYGSSNYRESSMLTFESSEACLRDGKLVADDGTILGTNDHVYLVCEPPGEPYYLGRIMEFLHVNNDPTKPVDALRMNWYYRPKDIGRKAVDTRQVYASMHSDISPLTALRGLCQIKHKSKIDNMDEYRRTQNCFWYEKLFDRYIHRYYEVIPTSQVVNVPAKVKRVLDDRWKFILVESGRGKELTSAVKSCKRCHGYCASNNSVDCAVCRQTYHMNCVRPPLLKKPSRGFAWACGPCSRAQERKLEARNTPNLADASLDAEDEELMDDEDEEMHGVGAGQNTGCTSPSRSIDEDLPIHPGTAEQIHQASLWPFRYLGVHCKVEDALDYDDRIYPRASSRLGPRHQANVPAWPGRPVELVKAPEIKRKYIKGGSHKKDAKLSKETIAALEAEKIARENRPKWVMDEPAGYVHRGEDYEIDDPRNTAYPLFIPHKSISSTVENGQDDPIDDYLDKAKDRAKQIGVRSYSVNFLDKAVGLLYSSDYNIEMALEQLAKVEKKDLKEPELTPAEIKKFEDAVAKFGSELHSVKKHVKTVSAANIVRFYYTWKKTERGKQVWDNYPGRKGKKEAKKAEANIGKLQDDVADDHDDSAFDNEKALEKRRGFQCKFCSTRTSRQWRRAPNTPAGTMVSSDSANKSSSKDKSAQLMVALCLNCAIVWRKYAVQWEDIDDHGKKAAQSGGRSNKRKAEDPLREFQLSEMSWTGNNTDTATTPTGGTPAPQPVVLPLAQEAPRKKVKNVGDKEQPESNIVDAGIGPTSTNQKKKAVEKVPIAPAVPEIPKPRILPCAVCLQMEPMGDLHLSCRECRMTVHRSCYGVVGEARGGSKWVCDMCSNDRNPQVSIQYKCMLCPIEITPQDFVEPVKVSHKKKTEKEREKDRLERENAVRIAEFYKKKQEEMNRPVIPREPLKRTANNNWVHVTCAVWTPEVKFGNAKALEPSEGIPSIPATRYDEICKICKDNRGACVSCFSCRAPFHVECAHQAGYVLGFDISPVKGSRRDQFNIVSIDNEAGTMTAAVWCKEHSPTKTIVHRMHEIVDETGLNALQLYVRNFKQADLALTGTVRKATLVNQSTKATNATPNITGPNRRASTTAGLNNFGRSSASASKLDDASGSSQANGLPDSSEKKRPSIICVTCGIDASPKWWPYVLESNTDSLSSTSGHSNASLSFISHGDHPTGNQERPVINAENASASPKQQVALAAAALIKNSTDLAKIPTEFQCHKCHYKKIQKPRTSPLQQPPKLPQETIQSHPRGPSPSIVPSTSALASPPTLANPPPVPSPQIKSAHLQSAHFAWPPTTYPPSGAYSSDWARQSPAAPPATGLRQYNGSHSPRGLSANGHHLGGQPQSRQPGLTMPQSPHLNGNLPQVVPNGYPPSPHRTLNPPHQLPHVPFSPYTSSRHPPHHLTNGGPPLRAPEHPFSQNNHSPYRSAFGAPSGNGFHHREHSNHNDVNASRPVDNRVNGGASASPSLQNLLS